MPETLEQPAMAKKTGRPKSARDDGSMKVDKAILKKAKLIAAARKITVAELCSEILRAPIEREFMKLVRDAQGKGG